MHARHSAIETLKLYLRPRQLVVFALGIAQGLPFALMFGTLTYWLAKVGIEASTVGLFGLAGLSYSLKFLWAPILDRYRLPILASVMGQRRSWLFLLQVLLMVAVVALGQSNPVESIETTALLAVVIGFLGASQDVVIDAYRIEILAADEQGAGAASIQYGWHTGAKILGGAAVLLLGKRIGYDDAYALASLFFLPSLAAVFLYGEPRHVETSEARELRERVENYLIKHGKAGPWAEMRAWLFMAVFAPFAEFMSRRGWYLILLFILLFKFGDAVAANQTNFFLFRMGFDEDAVALANKLAGLPPLLVGVALGGTLYFAVGAYRALFVTGVLMMMTNLMFVWLAEVGHNISLLVATIGFENFASGLGGTAVVAYLSGLCNKSFTATQYALLSAVTLLPRSIFASFSGYLAVWLNYDWPMFFIISTLAAIPGLLMLVIMRRAAFDEDGHPRFHLEEVREST